MLKGLKQTNDVRPSMLSFIKFSAVLNDGFKHPGPFLSAVGDRDNEHVGVRVQRLLHSGARAEAEVGEAGDAWRHAVAGQEGLVRFLVSARTGLPLLSLMTSSVETLGEFDATLNVQNNFDLITADSVVMEEHYLII